MDTSLLDMEVDPEVPVGAGGAGAPAGLPPQGMPVPQYVPPPPVPAPRAAPPAMMPTTTAGLPPPQIQPPGLPPPSMGGPAAPNKSVTDREATSSVSRIKVDPREEAAQRKLDDDERKAEELARQKGEQAQREAEVKAAGEERKRQILEQHGAALNGVIKQADEEWQRADQRYQQAFEVARNEKPKDFWGYDESGKPRTDTGSRKFWAGIAMALGGYTERSNGGHNTAYEMISGAIDRRDRMERERINRMREDAQSLKGERDVVLAKKHEKMADLLAKKGAAYDQAAQEIESRLAAMGKTKAEIDTNADVLKLRQQRDETKAQYLQYTRQEIRNQVVTKTQQIVGGPGTGAQDKPVQQWKPEERKAEGFAMRAWKASEEMEKSRYSASDKALIDKYAKAEALGGLTKKAMDLIYTNVRKNLSPEGKRRYDATKEFIISGLRPESGAAISLGEIADAEQRYGYAPGSTKATEAAARERRVSKIAELGLQTGRPQFWIQQTGAYGGQPAGGGAPSAAPAAQPQQGGEVKRVRNKRTGEEMLVRVGPDGRYYPVEQMAAR